MLRFVLCVASAKIERAMSVDSVYPAEQNTNSHHGMNVAQSLEAINMVSVCTTSAFSLPLWRHFDTIYSIVTPHCPLELCGTMFATVPLCGHCITTGAPHTSLALRATIAPRETRYASGNNYATVALYVPSIVSLWQHSGTCMMLSGATCRIYK